MEQQKTEQQRIFDTDRLIPTYFRLALPVVFSMVITLIYNLADTYFIARTNDPMIVAGVSLCAPLFTALMAMGNIYGQGGNSLISRLQGQGDRDSVQRVSSFCFCQLCILLSIIVIRSRTHSSSSGLTLSQSFPDSTQSVKYRISLK